MTDINLPPLPELPASVAVRDDEVTYTYGQMFDYARAAVLADREARAEPYLYVYEYHSAMGLHREFYPHKWNGMQPDRTVPLYLHPQPVEQRKPLTDAQIGAIVGFPNEGVAARVYYSIVRRVEAAHGIGEGKA